MVTITGNPHPLDPVAIDRVPDAPGTYALYIRDELVYYGAAHGGLREALRTHHEVERARFNRRDAVTGFTYECFADPDRRRRRLVFQFVTCYGQPPRRNAQEIRDRTRATGRAASRAR